MSVKGEGFAALVRDELRRSRERFCPLHSAHEAYGVLAEEVAEFFDLLRQKGSEYGGPGMLAELVQIAAVAQRAAEDLDLMPGGAAP